MSRSLLEIESALLACMLLSPRECADIAIQPPHLLGEANADTLRAYRAMEAAGEAIDAMTLAEWRQRHGEDRQTAMHGASLVADYYLAPANAPAYARAVMQAWRMRQAAEIGLALQEAREPEEVDAAVTRLLELHAEDRRYEHTSAETMSAVQAELLQAVENRGRLPGVTTGLHDLDAKLGGLHASDLVVVGARAAMGKTAFLLNLVDAAATAGHVVGVISAEQPMAQMGQRLVGLRSGQSVASMRSGDLPEEAWPRITDAITGIARAPIWWMDRASPSAAEIARIARKWKLKHGLKVLFIDYIQRLSGGEGEKRHEKVGSNIRAIKNLARELEVPIVALSQVSRDVEKRSNSVPRMGDLSDSSEIEKEADQVLMLYRPDYYDTNSPDAGKLQVIVDKNRHGPTGSIWTAWDAQTMRVRDLYRGAA